MPTSPGYADCSYELRQAGLTRPAYVTFGVDPTSTDPAAIATSLFNAYTAAGSLKSLFDNTVTMTAVRVSLGTDGTGDLVYVMSTSDVGGGGPWSTLPPNCAALIHKTTARGGRRGRGRMYLPWVLQESLVDEAGIILASTVTSITNGVNIWVTRLATETTPLVLLHGPGKTGTPAPDVVTSVRCDPLLATQRRRLGR